MQTIYKPEFYNDLNLTLNYIMAECSTAPKQRKHPLHQLYLSTHGELYPELRTIIFRRQDLKQGSLYFHTDKRSKKINEIGKNSFACLLGYHRQRKYQIRFRGQIELHREDSLTQSEWHNSGISSRRSYQTKFDPGSFTPVPSSGFDEGLEAELTPQASVEDGYSRFAVLHFKVSEIEWLLLHPEGHRRALFRLDDEKTWTSDWLHP